MAWAPSPPHGDLVPAGIVVGVASSPVHEFSKVPRDAVRLIEDHGVEGDTHAAATVQHRSRVARNPAQPNLRQVHLLHSELFAEVAEHGHHVEPGDLGENVTTAGVELLSLPTGTLVGLGAEAQVEVTGLRNPCFQIDRFSPGLLAEVVGRDESGAVVRKAGVMAVVRRSGTVRVGDPLYVVLPAEPHVPLTPV